MFGYHSREKPALSEAEWAGIQYLVPQFIGGLLMEKGHYE